MKNQEKRKEKNSIDTKKETKLYVKNVSVIKKGISSFKKEVNNNNVLNNGTKQAIKKALDIHESIILNNGIVSDETLKMVHNEIHDLEINVAEDIDSVVNGEKSIEDVYKGIEIYNKNFLPEIEKKAKKINLKAAMED